MFLRYLQQINRRTDDIEINCVILQEQGLLPIVGITEIHDILHVRLAYRWYRYGTFIALAGHSSYKHLLKMYEEDEDLIGDVIIEE